MVLPPGILFSCTAPNKPCNGTTDRFARSLTAAAKAQAEVLSGGERARLALAKFMMTKGTLLVLDEPTNHLDIPSKEMLEEACKNFQGALIAASHDRYFLRQVATRVLEVRACLN